MKYSPTSLLVLFWSIPHIFPLVNGQSRPSLPDPLLVTYWGQDPSEQSLAYYCDTGYFNVITIGFVDTFGVNPFHLQIDSEGCSTGGDQSGCSTIASDIIHCQNKGIKILISLGGATVYDCSDCPGNYTLTSQAMASNVATTVWESFFNGGQSTTGVWRPFGTAVVDGIDLDIEMPQRGNGQQTQYWYDGLVASLLAYDNSIIISGAPECALGYCSEGDCNPMEQAVSLTTFDFLFVQFYNDDRCGITTSGFSSAFARWSSTVAGNSKNPNAKIVIGIPGDTRDTDVSDPSFYMPPAQVVSTVLGLRKSYPQNHVGVGIWQARAAIGSSPDPNFAKTIANGLLSSSSSSTSTTSTSTTISKTTTSSSASSTPTTGLIVSPNGYCGAKYGMTCLGSYSGNCCSQYGYCGTTYAHCGSGCRPAYGLCGVPIAQTTNGFCGVKHRTTCTGTKFGACCSANGRCGNGSKFCGAGCFSKYGSCD